MTITVDLKPEVQAELARQAASSGKPVEDYVVSLLEEAVHLPAETTAIAEKPKNLVEVCAMVRGLTDDLDFSRNPSTGRPVDLS
jgi:hypothetical protein